jgi:hypothetical protein
MKIKNVTGWQCGSFWMDSQLWEVEEYSAYFETWRSFSFP